MSEAFPQGPDDLGRSAAALAEGFVHAEEDAAVDVSAAAAAAADSNSDHLLRATKRSLEEEDQDGAVAVAEKRARFEGAAAPPPQPIILPSTAVPSPRNEEGKPPAAAARRNINNNNNNNGNNNNHLHQNLVDESDASRRMRITMSPNTAELLQMQAQEAADAEQEDSTNTPATRAFTPPSFGSTDRRATSTKKNATETVTEHQKATPSLPSLLGTTSTTKTPPPSNRSSSITTATDTSHNLDKNHSEPAEQHYYYEDDESDFEVFNNKKASKIRLVLRLAVSTAIVVAVFASVFSAVKAFQHSPFFNNNQQQPPSAWWPSSWSHQQQQREKVVQDSSRSAPAFTALEGQPPLTLRDILLDHEIGFHLAMAPAFFGFYAYFGVLAAWYDAVGEQQHQKDLSIDTDNNKKSLPLKSVAGASAGAMTALLLAAGIAPDTAAKICEGITIDKFADFPGVGAAFRGNKFEALMHSILLSQNVTGQMEDALLPVAVTAFDLQTMRGHVLQTGSMARAARASATFPGLFQPVAWRDETNSYVFIDGGIADHAGLVGLGRTMPLFASNKDKKSERVINLSVGGFLTSIPPGPSTLPGNPEVVSIPILGTPLPGPWALQNGPRAFRAAREATAAALDLPLQRVRAKKQRGGNAATSDSKNEGVHYELVIDASSISKGNK